MTSLADALPDRIGTMVFCRDCGSLWTISAADVTTCAVCGTEDDATRYDNIPIVTRSRDSALPSVLRSRRHVVDTTDDRHPTEEATIEETCPSCGHGTATFYTLQLRSADEGSTVFLTCQACAHKWSTNN